MKRSIYHVDAIAGGVTYDVDRHFYTVEDACYAALEGGWDAAEIYRMRIAGGKVYWDFLGTYSVADDEFTKA